MDISHRLANPTPQPDSALPPKNILDSDPIVTFPVPLLRLPIKFKVLPVNEIFPPFEIKLPIIRSPLASKIISPPWVEIVSSLPRNRIVPAAEEIFPSIFLLNEFFIVLKVTVFPLLCCNARLLSAKFAIIISLSA